MRLIDAEELMDYAIECNKASNKWTGSRVVTMILSSPTVDADLSEENDKLKRELQNCRDELCLHCGNYKRAHLGACNGCRWKEM